TPLDLAVGVGTWAGISTLLDQISRELNQLLTTATADVQSSIILAKGSIDDVVNEINTDLKDRLDQAADIADDQQKKLWAHANSLVQLGNQLVENARAGAASDDRIAAQEIDITSYDALYYLPLRGKKTRVVYSTPGSLHVGDGNIIKIRGNFFDLAGTPVI